MGQVFQSGAFIQQCFAVHPLCLNVKRLDDEARLIVGCTSCKLAHRVVIQHIDARGPVVPSETGVPQGAAPPLAPREQLAQCVAEHALALSVRTLDVVDEHLGLRCAECRWMFELSVPTIETHQR
ncbi:MAG: hypothetical protein U0172_08375 [Nitrospiraceae bacterium]